MSYIDGVPAEDWYGRLNETNEGKFNKFATWNVTQLNARGFGDSAKRTALDKWGERYNIDFFMLEETKVNANCVYNTDNYIWFCSSRVKNEDRDTVQKLKENNQ